MQFTQLAKTAQNMLSGDKRGTIIETQLKLRHLSFIFCPPKHF